MQFIDLKKQYQLIEQDVSTRIKSVLEHGTYVMGPEVYELEQQLAAYVQCKHAIAVGSGTDALLVSLMALNIKEGDEVITTPFTFIATAETIRLLGARPIFVDIDPKTYNIDPDKIEAAITPKTKVIMPVNLYGQCADFDSINAIAKKYGLFVIEDAAQSFGATYKNRRSGNLGTIGCTSFFPAKPLGCYGDGGACFTDDDELADKIRKIRNHGQSERYNHVVLGINSRLDTLQAAILIAKLAIFDQEVKLRQDVAHTYNKLLPTFLQKPYIEPHNTSIYAQYTIQVEDRAQVQSTLNENGIPTAVHYPVPLHRQPVFCKEYAEDVCFPHADSLAYKVLSLPFHPYLTLSEIELICENLARATTVQEVA